MCMPIRYPLVLDGGLSNQLESQGNNLDSPLWTADLLSHHPEEIKKAHLAYLKAGARCLITSSYQATIRGFTDQGYDFASARHLLLKTVDLARKAAAEFTAESQNAILPLVAASIGPFGAYLANGSEYSGVYGMSDRKLTDFHSPRLQLLDQSQADFFAVETLPDFQEAKVLARMLENTKKHAWVSFSCRDGGHLRDSTPIEECIRLFAGHPRVFAIGVNCTAPRYISELIGRIRGISHNKRVVVYPNSGEIYQADSKTWSDTSDPVCLEKMVAEWLDMGADIIGGCCRLGPRAIRTIAGVICSRSPSGDDS